MTPRSEWLLAGVLLVAGCSTKATDTAQQTPILLQLVSPEPFSTSVAPTSPVIFYRYFLGTAQRADVQQAITIRRVDGKMGVATGKFTWEQTTQEEFGQAPPLRLTFAPDASWTPDQYYRVDVTDT